MKKTIKHPHHWHAHRFANDVRNFEHGMIEKSRKTLAAIQLVLRVNAEVKNFQNGEIFF